MFIGKCIEELQISFYCTRIDVLTLHKLAVTDDLDSKYFNQESHQKRCNEILKSLIIERKKGFCKVNTLEELKYKTIIGR
jgi:aspartate-semialdehyde dehydrogenase